MNVENFARFTRPFPEPHLLVDVEGEIAAANRAAERLAGVGIGGLGGRSLFEFLDDDEPRVREVLALAAASGDLIPGRLRWAEGAAVRYYRLGAGLVRLAAQDASPLILLRLETRDEGDPFLLLTRKVEELTLEIRRRMALEQERTQLLASEREAREEAERANRLKDEFMATLSHELRTPLNAILGWAALLGTGTVGEDKRDVALETITRAARAQARLIEDLLDFSRIVSGRLRLDLRPLNVSEVVEAALETVRSTAELKGIRLDVMLDPNSGPVTGDPERVQQVVWNLLSNAIKFTPQGGKVQVRVERVNSHVEIVISDTGEGIPREFLPFVFDRFRQADASHSRTHGGIGLGLSIARHLVEAHAGLIHATSAGPGEGSTFTVILPLAVYERPSAVAQGSHPGAEVTAQLTEEVLPSDTLQGLDVLILEDHPESRELLTTLLEGRGATVRAVASAEEARRQVAHRVPDIIIADIELPDEDGYTFLRKLRMEKIEEGGAVPAVAVTAFSRREDRLRALQAGFQMHLGKPIDPAELVMVVGAVSRTPHGDV